MLVEVNFAALKRVELGILGVRVVTLRDPSALHRSFISEGLSDSGRLPVTTATATATRVATAGPTPTPTIHRDSTGISIANLTPLSQADVLGNMHLGGFKIGAHSHAGIDDIERHIKFIGLHTINKVCDLFTLSEIGISLVGKDSCSNMQLLMLGSILRSSRMPLLPIVLQLNDVLS